MAEDKPEQVRLLISGYHRTHITDVATHRNVPWLLESGVHIQGKMGGIATATLSVLPHLDISTSATLRYICPTCQVPLEQEPIHKQVRITSDGIAISSKLTFTVEGKDEQEKDEVLVDVTAYQIDILTRDGVQYPIAVLDCIPLEAIKKYKKRFTPDGACHFCKRPLPETHHEDCSCDTCRRRKYRKYEAMERRDEKIEHMLTMTPEEHIAQMEA